MSHCSTPLSDGFQSWGLANSLVLQHVYTYYLTSERGIRSVCKTRRNTGCSKFSLCVSLYGQSNTVQRDRMWGERLLSVGFYFSLHDMKKKIPFLFLLFSAEADKYSFCNTNDSNVSTNGISLINALVTKPYRQGTEPVCQHKLWHRALRQTVCLGRKWE